MFCPYDYPARSAIFQGGDTMWLDWLAMAIGYLSMFILATVVSSYVAYSAYDEWRKRRAR